MLEEATGPRSPTGQPRAEAGFEPRVPSLRWGAWEPLSVHRSCETPNPGGLQLQVLFFFARNRTLRKDLESPRLLPLLWDPCPPDRLAFLVTLSLCTFVPQFPQVQAF